LIFGMLEGVKGDTCVPRMGGRRRFEGAAPPATLLRLWNDFDRFRALTAVSHGFVFRGVLGDAAGRPSTPGDGGPRRSIDPAAVRQGCATGSDG